ncbi:TlpA family protein disulfide reductase [Chitinophaga cymbidii]|uniref:Thiol-disulfide oxidoreductase ResA n=1 Tax=Chitinophaga cymbidii TaxID=1096750 RepID=A0A512RPM0_9BACT|nr:TlpA disulfide reductase family protein [Chitinophaga cymbidii]GEP97648.1 thiol-disulfide oxidoreductase ResA [Chitinophaga cymbidii]
MAIRKMMIWLTLAMSFLQLTASAQTAAERKQAFPFEFKDTLGRVVKLDDLKGKVVYMDFWFTGCKGCVQVAKGLHDAVLPAFREDTSVVFMSVSLDINFLKWKRSIREGLYTSEGELNVFTMGMGGDHPFYRHYGFSGAPQTMLIDRQGRVVSTSPPFPGPALVEMIRSEQK